jgi:hypothetical protein
MKEIPKPENLRQKGGVWFLIGSQQLHISMEGASGFQPARKAHPAFKVRGVEKLRDLLLSSGIKVLEVEPLEDAQRFHAFDPFGNRLEFIERKPD